MQRDSSSSVEGKKNTKSKKHRVRIEDDQVFALPDEEEDSARELDPAQAEKRKRVVRELLETEKAHVSALDIAVDHYYYPLTATNILPQRTIKAIFSNLEVIRNWNHTFLGFLEEELKCEETLLGSVFLRTVSYPNIFFQFVNIFFSFIIV